MMSRWPENFLKTTVRKIPFLELVGSCGNAMDALEIIHREKVELLSGHSDAGLYRDPVSSDVEAATNGNIHHCIREVRDRGI